MPVTNGRYGGSRLIGVAAAAPLVGCCAAACAAAADGLSGPGDALMKSAVVRRSASCPRGGPGWLYCGRWTRAARDANALYADALDVIRVNQARLRGYRRSHDGKFPPEFCPADTTHLAFTLVFQDQQSVTSAVLRLRPNGPGVCTSGTLSSGRERVTSFSAYGVTSLVRRLLRTMSR